MDNPINYTPKLDIIGRTSFCLICALLLMGLLAIGCNDQSVSPPEPENPPPGKSKTFGLVEVTLSGIGSDNMQAKAGPSPVASAISRPSGSGGSSDGSLQLEFVANGSFTDGTRGAGGQRYLFATFRVRNADSDGNAYPNARQNLTFMAVDTDPSASVAETFGVTPISVLRLFDGTELSGSAAEDIAEQTIPTGHVAKNSLANIVPTNSDVLQVYTESEVDALSAPTGVDLFPYGFVTRSPDVTPGARTLPASPAPGQFDGLVTFAFRMPLDANTANNDPFEITAHFLPVDDTETRITQSIEEQNEEGRTTLRQRANALGANVTNLPGSTFRGANEIRCNPVRVAGTDASPVSTLFNELPAFSSLSPDPYATDGSANRIAESSDFTASYGAAVSGANARSFVVRGSQSGLQFLGQSYTGNGSASVTTPTGDFAPGEQVEVSLTPGLAPCPGGWVARYRVEATAGNGNFSAASNSPFGVGNFPQSVALADIDGDGILDMVTVNSGDDNLSVLLGNGLGEFNVTSSSPLGVGDSPQSVAFGDLDGDGALDMVVTNRSDDSISILLGDGSGGFSEADGSPFVLQGVGGNGPGPQTVSLGDLNGDGALDMAIANRTSGDVRVLLGDGAGGFKTASGSPFTAGAFARKILLGDLNRDGALDMVVVNFDDDNVSVRLGDGSGGFGSETTFGVGADPTSAALGDLDGDGTLDMTVANSTDDNVSVRLGDGSGGFGSETTFGMGADPSSVALGDLDGDGALDMAVTNDNDDNVSVRLGDGSGGFGTETTFGVGVDPASVALGDLNWDGTLDIVTVNTDIDNVSVLLNQ